MRTKLSWRRCSSKCPPLAPFQPPAGGPCSYIARLSDARTAAGASGWGLRLGELPRPRLLRRHDRRALDGWCRQLLLHRPIALRVSDDGHGGACKRAVQREQSGAGFCDTALRRKGEAQCSVGLIHLLCHFRTESPRLDPLRATEAGKAGAAATRPRATDTGSRISRNSVVSTRSATQP